MIGTTQLINAFGGPASTTDDVDYPVTNSVCYKFDNFAKSETATTHYLFIGDAGNQSSSGRINSVDADFTYTRPTGYSEWGGSWDTSNKTGSATQTFEESDKKWTKSGTYYNAVWSTNKYHSGKYYAEIEFLGAELIYGISRLTSATGAGTTLQNDSVYYGSWATHSWKYSTTNTAEGAVLSTNDVIGLAADFDNQLLQVYRNNVLLDTVSIASPNGTETDIEYRAGQFGQAAVFNGSTSFIDTNYTLTTDTTFSFSWWMNADSPTTNHYIFNDGNGTGHDGTFAIYHNTSGQLGMWIGANGSGYAYGTLTITGGLSGSWMHFVVSIDGSTATVYKNGSLAGTISVTSHSTAGILTLIIGRLGHYSGYHFKGKIDQLRILPSALTSSQVTQLYNEIPETDTSNFKAVLYKGNDGGSNNTSQLINNVGFRPDLVWIKNREHTYNHILMDSVRGNDLILHANTTDVSASAYGGTLAIEALGFTTGKGDETNKGLANYNKFVAYCWKGGGTAVSNTQGTNITSSVSANTAAGFSIVEYTGTNNASNSVGHGLTSPPEIIVQKRTNGASSDWYVITDAIDGSVDYLRLNTIAAKADMSGTYSNFTLGSSTFSDWWGSGHTIINYCWHSVAGYSSIGAYQGVTGNKVITTGFRPSFVIIKNTSTASAGNWNMMDSRRDTSNPIELNLWADTSDTEATASQSNVYDVDFDNTGFTLKNNYTPFNQNGETYLYMAFK